MKKRQRGNPKLKEVRNKDVSAANQRCKDLADQHAREIAKAIIALQKALGGGMSYAAYADHLHGEGYRTRRGKRLSGRQISRIIKRFVTGKATPN